MIEKLEEYAHDDTSILKDKILLVTGGTGSFGNAVVKRFLKTDIKEIRILSRDEKKQDDMRREYNNEKIYENNIKMAAAYYSGSHLYNF